jgi:hypothetical protein
LNETFNQVNVIIVGSLIVSSDDDKKKASIGKGKDMQGLKQHVPLDCRKGIVGHTAVSPATLLTLGVCWEMEGQMEPIYGMNILEWAKNGIRLEDGSVLKVHHLFRAGLLQKKNRMYQMDSPDFIIIGTLVGHEIVAVVELKCRSKMKTQDLERCHARYRKFVSISCNSLDLHKYLLKRDEALQCAHHVSTLSVNYVLFVTGDCVSITSGVLIHYDNEFLSLYEKCVDDIYMTLHSSVSTKLKVKTRCLLKRLKLQCQKQVCHWI